MSAISETCRSGELTKKEKRRLISARYYQRNRDKILAKCAQYKASNKEKRRADAAEYFSENKELIYAKRLRYRAANRDKFRAQSTEWRRSNPEKSRANDANQRAIRRRAGGSFTRDDVARLLSSQKGKCVYCRVSIKHGFHIDHIKPISKGGSNWPDNLQLLCAPCNLTKHTSDPIVFAQQMGMLL
ncbi:5-methylcytosine-specific restriction endonuclease McrA [Bradyrhizobium ottawaense]|uniref:HNH endonuclease n=1 Tax=Bradyrhizobium ottawaense TaxID=931866 RepID=UPI0038353536